MIRLTVRATDESVPPVLLKLMVERLSAGKSTMAEKHVAPTPREISEAFGNVMVS
jgi:AP-2 complex subunit alpha